MTFSAGPSTSAANVPPSLQWISAPGRLADTRAQVFAASAFLVVSPPKRQDAKYESVIRTIFSTVESPRYCGGSCWVVHHAHHGLCLRGRCVVLQPNIEAGAVVTVPVVLERVRCVGHPRQRLYRGFDRPRPAITLGLVRPLHRSRAPDRRSRCEQHGDRRQHRTRSPHPPIQPQTRFGATDRTRVRPERHAATCGFASDAGIRSDEQFLNGVRIPQWARPIRRDSATLSQFHLMSGRAGKLVADRTYTSTGE